MGIRNQRIEIGYSIKTIIRCVYSIQDNEQFKFQTGFTRYENTEIPVWRPIDPTDKSLDATWRNGKWENIYTLNMFRKKDTHYIVCELEDVEVEGERIPLPKVSSELMPAFRRHLKARHGSQAVPSK